MGAVGELFKQVGYLIPDVDKRRVDDVARLLDNTEGMAIQGAAAAPGPIYVPGAPTGNPRYFKLAGETNDANSWQNAGYFQYSDNGSTLVTQIDNAGYIFNNQTGDIDFTVKGDSDATLLVAYAGEDMVAVGGATDASYKFKVYGATAIDGDLTFIGAQAIKTDAGNLELNPNSLLTFSKGLSANWDAGGYEIRSLKFQSDQTTGTAPLIVASTTVVTNLNADLLDGSHASAFILHSLADAANDFLAQ